MAVISPVIGSVIPGADLYHSFNHPAPALPAADLRLVYEIIETNF
jgi:hypothetical protein